MELGEGLVLLTGCEVLVFTEDELVSGVTKIRFVTPNDEIITCETVPQDVTLQDGETVELNYTVKIVSTARKIG